MSSNEIQTLKSLRQTLVNLAGRTDDSVREAHDGCTLFHFVHLLPMETRYLSLKRLGLSYIGPWWRKEGRLNLLIDEVDDLLRHTLVDHAEGLPAQGD